jgi:hypothetical protein
MMEKIFNDLSVVIILNNNVKQLHVTIVFNNYNWQWYLLITSDND